MPKRHPEKKLERFTKLNSEIERIINFQIPKSSNIKLPEIPGRIKAQTPTKPPKKIKTKLTSVNSLGWKFQAIVITKQANKKPKKNFLSSFSGFKGL